MKRKIIFILAFFSFSQIVNSQTQSITYFDENEHRTITVQNVMKIGYLLEFYTIEGYGVDTRYVTYTSNFLDGTEKWTEFQHAISRPSPNLTKKDLISFFELISKKNIGTGYTITHKEFNMIGIMVLSKPFLREDYIYWNKDTTGFYVHYTVYLKME